MVRVAPGDRPDVLGAAPPVPGLRPNHAATNVTADVQAKLNQTQMLPAKVNHRPVWLISPTRARA